MDLLIFTWREAGSSLMANSREYIAIQGDEQALPTVTGKLGKRQRTGKSPSSPSSKDLTYVCGFRQ
jgi:hypothetical protein